jgi:hypothetical protein
MPEVEAMEANRSDAKRIPNRAGRYIRRTRPWAVDPKRQDLPSWRDRLLLRRSSHRAARLSGKTHRALEDRFTADLHRLQEMVDVDLSYWPWYLPQ